jgi:hypothetical protein
MHVTPTEDPMSAKSHASGKPNLVWLTTGIVLPLIGLTTVFCLLFTNGYKVDKENGIMENLQAMFLLVSSCLFFVTSLRLTSGDRAWNQIFSLFLLNIAIREFDVRPFKIPTLTLFASGKARNLYLVIIWVATAIYLFPHRASAWRAFKHWLRTISGQLFLLAAVILSVAVAADKLHIFPNNINLFMEELIEINGYWIILVCAWCHFLKNRNCSGVSSERR